MSLTGGLTDEQITQIMKEEMFDTEIDREISPIKLDMHFTNQIQVSAISDTPFATPFDAAVDFKEMRARLDEIKQNYDNLLDAISEYAPDDVYGSLLAAAASNLSAVAKIKDDIAKTADMFERAADGEFCFKF